MIADIVRAIEASEQEMYDLLCLTLSVFQLQENRNCLSQTPAGKELLFLMDSYWRKFRLLESRKFDMQNDPLSFQEPKT